MVGLQRYDAFQPDLVLCDVQMPVMDGLEFLVALRKQSKTVVVVMMTAFGCEEYAVKALRAGANDYLKKPIRHSDLLPLLKKYAEFSLVDHPVDLVQMNERLLQINLTLRQEIQKQADLLVQSDKMASIGMLSVGIAHEISNSMLQVITNLSCLTDSSGAFEKLLHKYNAIQACLHENDNPEIVRRTVEELIKNKQLVFVLDEIRELIDESMEGALEVNVLLKDLKSFSRMEEAEGSLVNLNERLASVLKMMLPRIERHVNINRNYGVIPLVKCSPQKISQAFLNILLNAEQAIEGKGTITLTSRYVDSGNNKDEPRVELIFTDTGCGIPSDKLDRIFEPFFTTKPAGQGTGLGLKITRDIITNHGGTIAVDSEEGKGTTVTVSLPTTGKTT